MVSRMPTNGSAHGQRSAAPSSAAALGGIGCNRDDQNQEGNSDQVHDAQVIANESFVCRIPLCDHGRTDSLSPEGRGWVGSNLSRDLHPLTPSLSPMGRGSLPSSPLGRAQIGNIRNQCASSQLSAARASTASGTDSDTAGCGASSITAFTTGRVLLDFVLRHLEHQFVVHLQQHLRVELLLGERRVHAHHGAADDVGGGALQARIDGGALVEGADRRVRMLDLRIVALAAEQRASHSRAAWRTPWSLPCSRGCRGSARNIS